MAAHTALADFEYTMVPTALIDAARSNPRIALPEIPELAASIAELGLMQPLALRRLGPRYELVSGHRRLAAIKLLAKRHPSNPQWTAVAAVVGRTDDETADLMVAAAQFTTLRWSPAEECRILERLKHGRSLAQVGELLGRDVAWVSKRLRVHEDPVLASFVQSGALPVTVGEELLPVRDVAKRNELAARATREHWSQSRARKAVRSHIASLTKALLRELDSVQVQAISDAVWADLNALRAKIEATVPRAVGVAA